MADALTEARLDELVNRKADRLYVPVSWPDPLITLPEPMFDEIVDAAREALRLRGLIDAHNATMHSECESRAQHGTLCAAMQRTSRKRCVDCPRDNVIDADAAPGDVSRAAAPAPPAPPAPESSCPR